MSKPIVIGDTLERTYTFYQPLATDPTKPDTDNPVDLTGQTISFVIKRGTRESTFTPPDDLTVTPAAGRVELHLSAAKTALLKAGWSESFLVFSMGDRTVTKVRRPERLID